MAKGAKARKTVWTSSKSDWSTSLKELKVSEETLKQLKKELKDFPGEKDKERRDAFAAPVQDSSLAKSVG